jgi:hypothetical protein
MNAVAITATSRAEILAGRRLVPDGGAMSLIPDDWAFLGPLVDDPWTRTRLAAHEEQGTCCHPIGGDRGGTSFELEQRGQITAITENDSFLICPTFLAG